MSRTAQIQLRRTARVPALLAGLCVLCALPPAWAGRPVHVYEVDVDGQSAPALQNAMRQALVRATGRRESADDPAFASLVADAPKYVKSYAAGPRGESQVVFDAAAVAQAGERRRPQRLGPRASVHAGGTGAAAQSRRTDAARAELERVAAERGLPISLVPVAVDDAAGSPLGTDALMQTAQRYGGDEILVGRGEDAGPDTVLQWTLYTRTASEGWSGPLAAGIEHTVDFLVPPQGGSLAQTDATLRVRIDGVASLPDYANVARLLESVPGVRRANLVVADPGSVVFELTVRGGAAALEQGLAGSTRLRGGGTPPVYRYQPQG